MRDVVQAQTRGSARDGDRAVVGPGEVAFVFCIEGTPIESQALLLCESIRRFAGPYAASPVVAVNARPQLPIARRTEQRLAELGVRYVAEPLNDTDSPYLTINRIVSGRWAEAHLDTEFVALLDSDMLFVRPPSFTRNDAGVRPVDAKGSASAGPSDPFDAYWSAICGIAGIEPNALPFLTATIEGVRIRASYNGGFCVARRALGIFTEVDRVFAVSRERDLRPFRDSGLSVYASTGSIGTGASEWWGSSQAALSAVIHARTRDVRVYDDRYNVPLNLIAPDAGGRVAWPADAILLHYHWLAAPEHRPEFFRRLAMLGVGDPVQAWLRGYFAAEASANARASAGSSSGSTS